MQRFLSEEDDKIVAARFTSAIILCLCFLSGLLAFFGLIPSASAAASISGGRGRIVILMIWDGLRPDFVTAAQTPNLFSMASEGVWFKNHHAVYPDVTMVNAASLATGGDPGSTGIFGDKAYLARAAGSRATQKGAWELGQSSGVPLDEPVDLDSESNLALLNQPGELSSGLLGLESIGGRILKAGGYLAVLGKNGPTFFFAEHAGPDAAHVTGGNYLFASDSNYPLVPALNGLKIEGGVGGSLSVANRALAVKVLSTISRAVSAGEVPAQQGDAYFTQVAIAKALPRAKEAALNGRPALVVLWQRNPDLTQHLAGLGSLNQARALTACDLNLRLIRTSIARLGIASLTDLNVVSDHGFATIRMNVDLAGLLVAAGLKEGAHSRDVIVVPGGGSDAIFVSDRRFATPAARRAILQRIVNYAEAQLWCGPIFSRDPVAPIPLAPNRSYLGWITGTFSEQATGLFNSTRSPDLIVSFREFPERDNSSFAGPEKQALSLGADGPRPVPNHSQLLARPPVKGVLYSDTGGYTTSLTTGQGMHGSAGTRELHNTCVALGPDFRRHFVDLAPSGNADIAPTLVRVLNLTRNSYPARQAGIGRVLDEALAGEAWLAKPGSVVRATAHLDLPGIEVINTLRILRLAGHDYLDGSDVTRRQHSGDSGR
jgi:hypothetical protein